MKRYPVGSLKIAVSTAGNLQLPLAERADIESGVLGLVGMTLFCTPADSGDCPSSVSIPLTSEMARDLAIRLWLAADQDDSKTGNPRKEKAGM
jgi:hypothetical protein